MADTTLKEGTRLDGLLNDHILYTDGGSEICGLAEHDAALIHDELRALRESHDALVVALRGHGNVAGRHGWHSTLCAVTGNCPPECAQSRAALAKAEALGAVGAQG